MQVLIIEFLGKFATTVKLNWSQWLISIIIGIIRSVGNSMNWFIVDVFQLLASRLCLELFWMVIIVNLDEDSSM